MEHTFNILIVVASVVIFLVTWFTMNPGQNFFALLLWLVATSLIGVIFGLVSGIPIEPDSINFMGLITAGIQVAFFAYVLRFKFTMEVDSSYWSVLGAFTIAAVVFNIVPV